MEYTAQDFAEAFRKKRGMIVGTSYDPIYCLLPHIMMGVAYEYYEKDIQHLKLRHNCQHYRTLWAEAYTKFNNYLFEAFDLDMTDAFCDKMDKFKRFMYADLVSLQSKLMRCLPADMDADRKRVMAAAMMTNRKRFGLEYVKGDKRFKKVVDDEALAADLFASIDAFEMKCLKFKDFDKATA